MAGPRSSIDVFLRLFGQREFSREVAKSGAELEALGLKGARAMSAFAAQGEKLKKFGKSWTHNVSLPVAGLGVIAGGMAVNFKRQMGLIATDAGGTAKEVGVLEKSVLGLTRETQYGPTQLAEALFHVESAGYRGAKAMKVLRESTKLATAGNSDLEETTYALVSANKALNEGQSLKGITKTAAQMNEIVAHGDIRLEELTAAMSTGLFPTAKALGLKVADVGSALDIMTARGIPAQKSAYALNFTLQKLIPSTDKASEAFANLGIGHEELLKISQRKGLPWGLERLKQAMQGLSKGQQIQTIDEMFGGGRMSKGLLVVIQHLGEAKQKWHEVNGDVALYKKHVKEAEEQPLVKLKKAWSGIQASLVEIGNDLMPIAGPALEKLASTGEKLSHAFLSLPGPVKAATIGFLVLTGPVASGLGYFANGIGRALILTTKLVGAAKDFSIFTTALKAGQGLGGSASMAFGTYGESAAVQTAKGFALSLGPAVAAFGIGNILTSSLSGDWKDAGFEAGGAIAGGIAGFMLGGPMGAMLGVGLGSLGGELLSGLFHGSKAVTIQNQIASSSKGLKTALEQERSAAEGLARSGKNLVAARKRQKSAIHGEKRAEHELEAVRQNAPAGSMAIVRAESKVARSIERVTHAKKKAKRAERVHGQERTLTKESLRYLTLEERHRKRLLKARLLELRSQIANVRANAKEGEKLQKTQPLREALLKNVGRLHTVNKQANETMQEAAAKVGPKFATFLRHGSREALNLGSSLKALKKEANQLSDSMERLSERTFGLPEIEPGTEPRGGRPSVGPRRGEPGNPGGNRGHKPRNAGGARGRAALMGPSPHRLQIKPGSLEGALNIHLTSHHVIELEGKPVAESTTREVKRKQLLE
jgi:TP901 family phage tail tape measure protein